MWIVMVTQGKFWRRFMTMWLIGGFLVSNSRYQTCDSCRVCMFCLRVPSGSCGFLKHANTRVRLNGYYKLPIRVNVMQQLTGDFSRGYPAFARWCWDRLLHHHVTPNRISSRKWMVRWNPGQAASNAITTNGIESKQTGKPHQPGVGLSEESPLWNVILRYVF